MLAELIDNTVASFGERRQSDEERLSERLFAALLAFDTWYTEVHDFCAAP